MESIIQMSFSQRGWGQRGMRSGISNSPLISVRKWQRADSQWVSECGRGVDVSSSGDFDVPKNCHHHSIAAEISLPRSVFPWRCRITERHCSIPCS